MVALLIDFNAINQMTVPGMNGSSHSIENTGPDDLVLLTVVVER